jgi:hypothetical protein
VHTLLEVRKPLVPGVRVIADLICPLLVRSFGSSGSTLSAVTDSVDIKEVLALPVVQHGTACGAAAESFALHIEHLPLS